MSNKKKQDKGDAQASKEMLHALFKHPSAIGESENP